MAQAGGRRTGASLARYALEQLPISYTFGIPGVHNTELYDELNRSAKIHPVLVTHEGCGAFAADAVSRTGGGQIGCLVIVPAAGVTHAMSGIGECYLGGIPLLIITGGIRTDSRFGYQLHEVDQRRLTDGLVKAAWKVEKHSAVVPTIFEAYRTATSGLPGPVLVEIPLNVQLFAGTVEELPDFEPASVKRAAPEKEIEAAARLLAEARSPGIFVGWGAVDVAAHMARIAEILGAPVATTLQGMSAFPGNHPLHTGMGFSRAAVPAAENAFRSCDCLLAVGTRFAEIPTGSFGCEVPRNLIHIDISPEVIGRNFPARIGIGGDARLVIPDLLQRLESAGLDRTGRRRLVEAAIAKDKQTYRAEWHSYRTGRVNPALFFDELRQQLSDDAIVTVDDGNHTYLAAELFEARAPRSFICPSDFNCMGYAVPAAIGAKLANPARQVVSIVGDGAFLMTGLELVTAASRGLGIACFIFNDGELSQIAQAQQIPYNRKSCTVLGKVRFLGIAEATGARYVPIDDNDAIAAGIGEALRAAAGHQPVIVDVRVDYSKRTRFTQGVVKTVLKRFPVTDRLRFIGRALLRKVTG